MLSYYCFIVNIIYFDRSNTLLYIIKVSQSFLYMCTNITCLKWVSRISLKERVCQNKVETMFKGYRRRKGSCLCLKKQANPVSVQMAFFPWSGLVLFSYLIVTNSFFMTLLRAIFLIRPFQTFVILHLSFILNPVELTTPPLNQGSAISNMCLTYNRWWFFKWRLKYMYIFS